MHRKGIAKTGRTHPTAQKIFGVVIILCLLSAIIGGVKDYNEKAEATKDKALEAARIAATNPLPATVLDIPQVIYGITPTTITANYLFNIEADGPIIIEYPGHKKPVLYIPGLGKTNLPQPAVSGPKVFTDPKNPTNGHTAFRLYRLQ
ncbi:hypothetical protein EXS45_01905 [Candidatus Nomurabacteria bacterium]|nr:hypothetical protein [Candidatus Nomurabacteria bacterium]